MPAERSYCRSAGESAPAKSQASRNADRSLPISAPCRYFAISGPSSGSSICDLLGVASRLCDPISRRISFARGIQIGMNCFSWLSGGPYGNQTPLPKCSDSASAVRIAARASSA
jgi:hypothetical protein